MDYWFLEMFETRTTCIIQYFKIIKYERILFSVLKSTSHIWMKIQNFVVSHKIDNLPEFWLGIIKSGKTRWGKIIEQTDLHFKKIQNILRPCIWIILETGCIDYWLLKLLKIIFKSSVGSETSFWSYPAWIVLLLFAGKIK